MSKMQRRAEYARTATYREWRACLRKARYAERGEAAMRAKDARVKSGDWWIKEYRCEFCSRWHIGHDKDPRRSS